MKVFIIKTMQGLRYIVFFSDLARQNAGRLRTVDSRRLLWISNAFRSIG